MTADFTSRRGDPARDLDVGAVRWPPAASPFLGMGAVGVVGGGLVAAVTRPLGWDHGAWAAAFLVLVVGVGQVVLGSGQAMLAAAPLPRRTVLTEAVLWNGGAAWVVAGTAAGVPLAVTIGGALLLVPLVLFASVPMTTAAAGRWWRRTHHAVIVVLLVSTPVGLVLAWQRP